MNREVEDAAAILSAVRDRYAEYALSVDDVDGLRFELKDWTFNIRISITEPVVGLNVESRADPALMRAKTREVLKIVEDSA